jgi:hypothetical protein
MVSGALTAKNDAVAMIEMSRDVKLSLISEENAAEEIVLFQNDCARLYRKLRSKLFITCCKFLDYILLIIFMDLDGGYCEELCGQSFAESVTLHLLERSISSDAAQKHA